ncbi:MAG: GerMN domain-containing protein [Actinomycetota bacterium]
MNKFSKPAEDEIIMKNLKKNTYRILILTVLVGLTLVGGNAQTNKSRKVKVYFWEFNKQTKGDELTAFTREVDAKSPLRPTIEAFVAGPTAEEEAKGFSGLAYGDMKLASVKIKNGTARIDFTREIRADYNPGDLETLRFEDAVTRTAKQFPTVKKVVVCVNGINEFGIGMVIDRPKPCPKEK